MNHEVEDKLSERGDAQDRKPGPNDLEAERLYEAAMTILNKTRSDKEKGYKLLLQSAEKGHVGARLKIAWSQLLGQHPVELNVEKAKSTFIELSEQGFPDAQMGLGFMYASGIGVNVSQARAILYYSLASYGGNTWAQMVLGYRHLGGIGVTANCDLALEYYTRVAREVASTVTFSGIGAPHRIRLLDEVDNSGASGILDNDLLDYYQLLADKGDVQVVFTNTKNPLDRQLTKSHKNLFAGTSGSWTVTFSRRSGNPS